MKSIKKSLSLTLFVAVIIIATACGGNKETSDDKKEASETGAWSINDQKIEAFLPDEVEKAFNKATEGFTGGTPEPVAYVGSQVVAGMNYMILCRETASAQEPETTYKMAVIYADLEGNAKLTSLNDFDFTKFTEGDSTTVTEEDTDIVGGWSVPEDAVGAGIPKDINDVYEKAAAAAEWTWSKVDPLAYLGSQVVAGNNYALICRGESPSEKRSDSILVVTIYEDLNGKAVVSNIHLLDLTDFTD